MGYTPTPALQIKDTYLIYLHSRPLTHKVVQPGLPTITILPWCDIAKEYTEQQLCVIPFWSNAYWTYKKDLVGLK